MADSSRDYMDLFAMADIAEDAGGKNHHFRFVQLPFNLAMPEAYGLVNQRTGKRKDAVAGGRPWLGIAVMGSATLYQARLTQDLPDSWQGFGDEDGLRTTPSSSRAPLRA